MQIPKITQNKILCIRSEFGKYQTFTYVKCTSLSVTYARSSTHTYVRSSDSLFHFCFAFLLYRVFVS